MTDAKDPRIEVVAMWLCGYEHDSTRSDSFFGANHAGREQYRADAVKLLSLIDAQPAPAQSERAEAGKVDRAGNVEIQRDRAKSAEGRIAALRMCLSQLDIAPGQDVRQFAQRALEMDDQAALRGSR